MSVSSFSPPSGKEKKSVILLGFQEEFMNISKEKKRKRDRERERKKITQFVRCYQQLKILYLITMGDGTVRQSSLTN